jgi:GT2 family glycosyltransferase
VKALSPDPGDIVLIANDDTSFDADFLKKAAGEMVLQGPGAMLCASIRFSDTDGWNDGGTVCYWPRLTFKHYRAHPEKIDCASTRCIFFHVSDMAVSGTFRPGLLRHYLSDYEFTIRAHRNGMTLLPAKSVVCFATEHTTGSHQLKPGPLRTVVAQMMSPGFSANPLSLFMFVYMAAPFLWRPVCWVWAFRTFFGFLLKATVLDRLTIHAT